MRGIRNLSDPVDDDIIGWFTSSGLIGYSRFYSLSLLEMLFEYDSIS